jgi:hypothetical protein
MLGERLVGGTQLAGLAILLACLGCNGEYASVEGRVLLDGQPLLATEDVTVSLMFYPTSGGAVAAGAVDESGYYSATTGGFDGLKRGKYNISVQGVRITPDPAGKGYPKLTPLTPKQYAEASTSGLAIDVTDGGVEYDIEMVSKK